MIVTAQRKEESAQKAAVSVKVITGAALESSGTGDTRELQNLVPSLVFSSNSAFGQPYLRGVGNDILAIGADPTLAVYVDDVYHTRPVASIQDLFDVARVEVLKGPQGTLYGRNATAGALKIVNRQPEAARHFEVGVDYGNFETTRMRALANFPLVRDRVLARLVLQKWQHDGFTENLVGEDLDDKDTWAGRLTLRFLAGAHWDLTLAVDHRNEDDSRLLGAKVDSRAFSPAVALGAVIPEDGRHVKFDQLMNNDLAQYGQSLRIERRLEHLEITSLTGFRVSDYDNHLDIDATDIDFSRNRAFERSEAFTQEFQVSGEGRRFSWLAGLFSLKEDASQNFNFLITQPAETTLSPAADSEVQAHALFGSVTGSFGEHWKGTLGARYSHEEKEMVINHVIDGGSIGTSRVEDDWDAIMPRLSLEYHFAETMYYFNIARGFKSGGFDANAFFPPVATFEPETLWSYEVGLKTSLAEGRITLSGAGFFYDYRDLQVNQFEGAANLATIRNAAAAEVKGLEWEVRARLQDSLSVQVDVAFLDATYQDYVTQDPDGTDPVTPINLAGNSLPRAPEFSSVTSLLYRDPNRGGVGFRLDHRYQSRIYFNQFEADFVEQEAFHLWSAQISYEPRNAKWRLSLTGQNLSDELYRESVVRSTGLIGTLQFFGPPRTYYGGVTYRW
ncbi:TonB-dependent receptor [Sulfidibacter corallicola]|uniref:TonB-dependent receptor n=1 Tax=Sulfidibacter corallicola TaxID=2818388 RepID=UPI002351F2F2|nr:TonB-dependent receptor [Sulfidibacter corallicola]